MAKSVLITGCSSGIGRHAALALKARGWHVLATCRKQDDCAALEAEGLESCVLDLDDPASIAEGFEESLRRTGGTLDALFNNGAHAQPGALEDVPVEALRAIFETNFFGWHDLTRRTLAVMRRTGQGRIVQNSSILGFAPLRMRGAYNATKFAIEGYTDTLRLELAGSGIHIALLQPGPVTTRIRVNAQPHYERWIDRESPVWGAFYKQHLEPRLYDDSGKPDRFELGCEATTERVIHALESPRPRDRYPVTTPTYMAHVLKRALPGRWFGRILLRA